MTIELSNKTVIARKRHQCEWCGGTIERGDTYVRVSQISDGDFFATKAHKSCEDLIRKFWSAGDYNDDEGITSDEFKDIVRAEWSETHGTREATWPEMLEWCKQMFGVSDRLDQLYFENEDAETCEALRFHLERAKEEGRTEITLHPAVYDPVCGYEWCRLSGSAVDRAECRKGHCDDHKARPDGKRGCEHRGEFYLHGDVETLKVE